MANELRVMASQVGNPRGIEAGTVDARAEAWSMLRAVALDPQHLAESRIVTASRSDPAHNAFDLLRTRLMQALKARGWRNVGISSPTKGCGKTFVAANLAMSLARRASTRTVLIDLDLRLPSLARVLGVRDPGQIEKFLTAAAPLEAHFRLIASNVAAGLNGAPSADAAELINEPSTESALAAMRAALDPDIVLFDLPPTLACDDVIAMLPHLDGILLVVGGGITTAEEVRRCERLFDGQVPLLGIVFNRAEDARAEPYYG